MVATLFKESDAMKSALAALIILSVAAPLPALAFGGDDDMKTLTPAKVKKLVDNMTEKTKPGGSLNDQGVKDYLNEHLASDGVFTSTVTFRIPGYEDQVQMISVDKAKFIENVIAGRQQIKDYESKVKVREPEVTKDKKSATLKLETREEGLMPMQDGKWVPFKGQSDCFQEIRINGNKPQIYSAACQSLIEIQKTIK